MLSSLFSDSFPGIGTRLTLDDSDMDLDAVSICSDVMQLSVNGMSCQQDDQQLLRGNLGTRTHHPASAEEPVPTSHSNDLKRGFTTRDDD